jgi:hypothetical protein
MYDGYFLTKDTCLGNGLQKINSRSQMMQFKQKGSGSWLIGCQKYLPTV